MHLDKDWHITHLPVASSSNDIALELIKTAGFAANKQCIIVDEQTSGRGRMGRQWQSGAGDGLYMSGIYHPRSAKQYWAGLSFAVSLAVYRAVISFYPMLTDVIHLKWPNDLVTSHKKLAGILLESVDNFVVFGCGVNLSKAPEVSAAKMAAGCLADLITGQTDTQDRRLVSTSELGAAILGELDPLLDLFETSGTAPVIEQWKQHCAMIGQSIELTLPHKEVQGMCDDIDADGRLILLDKMSNRHVISTGDVHVLAHRPAYGSEPNA